MHISPTLQQLIVPCLLRCEKWMEFHVCSPLLIRVCCLHRSDSLFGTYDVQRRTLPVVSNTDLQQLPHSTTSCWNHDVGTDRHRCHHGMHCYYVYVAHALSSKGSDSGDFRGELDIMSCSFLKTPHHTLPSFTAFHRFIIKIRHASLCWSDSVLTPGL